MSITVLSKVIWTNLPTLKGMEKNGKNFTVSPSTAKLVLVAIADSADDFGENSYNSLVTLATKSSLAKKSVIRAIRALVQSDYCKYEGLSHYGTSKYSINLEKLGEPPKKRDRVGRPETSDSTAETSDSTAETSDSTAKTSDSTAKTSDSRTPEPSLTVLNQKHVLSEKDKAQANAKVDAILENARRADKYAYRKDIPEPLQPFADVYHELTGQVPSKKTLFDWIATFSEWQGLGLQEEHIRRAYSAATFTVVRPGSLTNTAQAIQAKPKAASPYRPINTAPTSEPIYKFPPRRQL